MNRTERINHGLRAQQLLDNPVFTSVVAELSQAFTTELFATPPAEATKREEYYHQHVALQHIVGLLQARANAAQQLLTEESDDDALEPFDLT